MSPTNQSARGLVPKTLSVSNSLYLITHEPAHDLVWYQSENESNNHKNFQITNYFQIHSIFHVDGSKSSTQAGKIRVHFILYLSKKLPQFVGRKIFGGSHLGITWQLSIFQTYSPICHSRCSSSCGGPVAVRDKTNREWGRAICNILGYNH